MRIVKVTGTIALAMVLALLTAPAGAGILDIVPGAEAAYSLRQLTSTYTGPAIQVRRGSDSALQDIGFVNGQIDTSSLLSFANGGSVFVITWYDQTGNGYDLTREATNLQPQIVTSAGNLYLNPVTGMPAIRFSGRSLNYPTGDLWNDELSVFTAASWISVPTGSDSLAQRLWAIHQGANTRAAAGGAQNEFGLSWRTTSHQWAVSGEPLVANEPFVVSYLSDATKPAGQDELYLYRNGEEIFARTNLTLGDLAVDSFTVGAHIDSTRAFNGIMHELILYHGVLSPGDRALVEHSLMRYVPEPGSAMLLLAGVLALLAGRRLRMVRKTTATKACATIAVLVAIGCGATPPVAVAAPIYFDFGQSTYLSPEESYNNVTSATSTGQKTSDAIDADGTNTGIKLSVTERFHAAVTNGMNSSAAGFHQNAQRDSFYVREGAYDSAAVRLGALHPHLLYDIVLFGSRSSEDGMTDRYTVYSIDGVEQVLDTKGNTSNVVTFPSVAPSSSGQIDIGVRLLTNDDTALLQQLGIAETGTDHGYLSAMKVTTDGIVKYSTAGQVLTETFDSLANSPRNGTEPWSNNSTLPGWYFSRASGELASTYTIFDGNGAKQDVLLSLGHTDDSDRALGFQSSSSAGTVHYGFRVENNTPMTLDAFHLGYTGEQWRAVNSSDPSKIIFEYQVFDSGEGDLLAATGWTAIDSLEFVAPHYHSSSSDNRGLDGNDPANREALYGMAMDVSWGPGQELWLRWTDIHPPHQMMGIDDVWFRAVPEPSSLLLLLVGGMAVLFRRRRRD